MTRRIFFEDRTGPTVLAVILILGMIAILVVTWSYDLSPAQPLNDDGGGSQVDNVYGIWDELPERMRTRLRRLDIRQGLQQVVQLEPGSKMSALPNSTDGNTMKRQHEWAAWNRLESVNLHPLLGCGIDDEVFSVGNTTTCTWPTFDPAAAATTLAGNQISPRPRPRPLQPSAVRLVADLPVQCFQGRMMREAALDVFERALQSLAEKHYPSSSCIDFARQSPIGRTVLPEAASAPRGAAAGTYLCNGSGKSDGTVAGSTSDEENEHSYMSAVTFNMTVAGTSAGIQVRLAYPDAISRATGVGATKATAALVLGSAGTVGREPHPLAPSMTARFQAKWLAVSVIAHSIEAFEDAC